jgi:autotransporter-associated beta strand protein
VDSDTSFTGTLTVGAANGSGTFSGTLQNAGSGVLALVKTGTGTQTLTGPLNYTGGTTVNGGVLVLSKGDVPFPGLGSTGQFGSAHTVTINSGGTLQVAANWVLGDGLQHTIKVNGGTLEFANSDNYQGKIELTGGRITTSGGYRPWRTGNWGDGLITVKASSTSSNIEGSLCFVGTSSATKTTFSVEDGAAADDLVVSATIYDHPGYERQMTLVKDGPGTMKLTGPLNYTGGTTVNGGVLVLAQPGLGWTTNGQFGSSGHVLTVNSGATLRLTERGLLGNGQSHQLILNGGTVEFLHETYQSRIEMTGGRIVSTPSGSIVNVWRTGNAGNGQITVKASANSSTIEGRLTLVKTASATKTTFDVEDGPAAQDLIVSAEIIDHGGGYEGMELVKTGAGTMVLSGTNTYIGPTTILAGKLLLTGTHTPATTPGLYTVGAGGLLGGTGTTKAPVLIQGTIAPGASVGTIHTGSQTWAPAGTYQWEIQDVDAGPGTGWDLVDITGTLDITATPAQPFVIDVVSLGAGGLPGLVGDFNPLGVYSWEIARTTGGVSGFSPEKFLVDLDNFQNSWHGGRWWVSLGNQGNSVFLNYAIPEPSSGLLALLALVGLGLWRWLNRSNILAE